MRLLCGVLVTFAFLPIASACAADGTSFETAAAVRVSNARVDDERLSQIPSRMQEFVDDGKMAGAVMLLAVDGEIVLEDAVGYQDIDTRKAMSVETLFQIQSMTKPITAVAAMILVEEGLLRLSDSVAKYLPEFRARETLQRITVLHLLTHSSGLPHGHLPDRNPPTSESLAAVVTENAKAALLFEPGEGRQYSNFGIETLGRVIEVVAGQPYEQVLMERVLSPVGMESTFFRVTPEYAGRVAEIYSFDGSKLQHVALDSTRPYTYTHPGAGLLSTARDQFAFYQMMLDGGVSRGRRVVSPASVKTMTALYAERPPSDPRPGHGLVWWVVDDPMGLSGLPMQNEGSYGHGGYWGTLGWLDPETRVVGIFLTHSFEPTDRYDFAERFAAMAAAALKN